MREVSLLLLFCAIFNSTFAQNKGCNLTLSAKVIEASSSRPIAHAQVKLFNQITLLSNHSGLFEVKNMCKETINMSITHISYQPIHLSFDMNKDTSIVFRLEHKSNNLEAVQVESIANKDGSLATKKIAMEARLESQGKNLAEVLSDVSGVSILKTGSTIAKPVVNGLFGNRLILLNNGVRHESQQWGTDHAPEIDPFSSQEITVIKNADAVRYGPDALGGVIKMELSPITHERKFAGRINTGFNSNSRAAILNTQIEGTNNKFSYRVGVTGIKSGNVKTADYYLGNTGKEELNGNVLLKYGTDKSELSLYLSHFGTTLGIFEGAHIGSKEDILARIEHGKPFETYSFGYDINAPRQRVTHQLAKLGYNYQFSNDLKLETFYSIQQNHRREFDLRRAVSDDVPMANIKLNTQQIEVVLKNSTSQVGISGSLQVNNNIAGTGTTPIIPNFDNHTFGAFATHKWQINKSTIDVGIRYDYKYFDAAGYRYDYEHIDQNGGLQQYLLADQKQFHNVSGIAGITNIFSNNWIWKNNVGLAWRAPSANELYSDGIHHGTGTYEVGDINLKSEKGLKYVSSLQYNKSWFSASVDAFGQYIDNYIYSQPNPDSVRQTIRGTFPLFQYGQKNALFYGVDISALAKISQTWHYQLNVSSVRAKNITDDTYLPYIPADKLQQAISYRFGDTKAINGYFKLKHHFQAKQSRYESNSDFAVPPAAYHLFDVVGSITKKHNNTKSTTINLGVENILNTSYKDYMDRFRYYAHGLGRNISLKINHTF